MNNYNEFTVTLYANIVSCILLCGLFILSKRNTLIQKTEGVLFRLLLLPVVLMAVLSSILYGMLYHVISGSNILAVVLQSGLEIAIDMLIFGWLVYVNYRVYHSADHIKRNWVKFTAPALVFLALDLINAFTGIFYWYDGNIEYHEAAIYDIVYLIKYAMFFGAIIELIIHKSRKLNDMKFFSIAPFLIPTVCGLVISVFTPYYLAVPGFAIGYTLLYGVIMNECRYLDKESGFKNGRSLDIIKEQIQNGQYEPESLIYIKTDAENISDFSAVLASQMIDGCETYRVGEKEFITLTTVEEMGPLRMFTGDISDALGKMGYSCDMVMKLRKKDESGEEFLKNQLEQL